MSRDHVTKIRVQGLRVLADVSLPLRGLTVLVGDNGTGKSTFLEALELLHKAARPGSFVADQLGTFHGGLESLLRAGARELRLEARIEGGGDPLEYRLALALEGGNPVVLREELDVYVDPAAPKPLHAIRRDRSACWVFDVKERKPQPVSLPPVQLALTAFGAIAQPAIARAAHALERGVVHPPFNVQPGWVSAERQEQTPIRAPAQVARADELARLGDNLANCYLKLKGERPPEAWTITLERVRAGLGEDIVDLPISTVGRGRVELAVSFRGVSVPVPSASLSDGQLCYLGFVALAELGQSHSFVAVDEPESHLHPQLLVRVVWLLEELARECPVVIATHSDRLLDALSDPASAVILCEVDAQRAARLRRPDRAMLGAWLERYRGLGSLRAEGYAPHVFGEPERDAR
jgi:predicted ATPase